MQSEKRGELTLMKFSLFEDREDVDHCVTTRSGGVSEGNYKGLNLSDKSGDDPARVLRNRETLAEAFGVQPDHLYFPDQCHTSYVKAVDRNTTAADLENSDALITDEQGVCLGVLAADCVPVLLFDPVKRVIAAVHSGWKGTTGRIVARTVEQMVKKYRVQPTDLLAGIGPAVSARNYEVDAEVAAKFDFWFRKKEKVVLPGKAPGKFLIDLPLANKILLLRYGLREENIEPSGLCTYDHPDMFFSARRDGFHSGRFAACIMLKKKKTGE